MAKQTLLIDHSIYTLWLTKLANPPCIYSIFNNTLLVNCNWLKIQGRPCNLCTWCWGGRTSKGHTACCQNKLSGPQFVYLSNDSDSSICLKSDYFWDLKGTLIGHYCIGPLKNISLKAPIFIKPALPEIYYFLPTGS